jgi:two-component system phosphate regulon sensor histidine kinase PhoR
MRSFLQTRPTASGLAAIALVVTVSLAMVVSGASVAWTAVAILLAGVVAAIAFVVGPGRANAESHERQRSLAARVMASMGSDPPKTLAGENSEAGIEAILTLLVDAVPQARSRAESAERDRNAAAGVLQEIRLPILGTDHEGRILSANAAMETLLAVAGSHFARALIGRNIAEVVTQREVLDLHRTAAGGESTRGEVRWLLPTGARTVEVSAVPWNVGAGLPGVVLTLMDVTAASEAVRLRTDFVANASHELRTPLAAIKGAIETLEGGAEDEPSMRRRLLRMIADNATRLEDLTRDLLDLSRLESPEAPVSITRVRVEEIESSMRTQFATTLAERDVRLVFQFGVTEVLTDTRLLQLILRNLIENALKFANDDTDVVVKAEHSGGVVRWSVADRGIGIPFDQQQRIFERFYQVDGSRTGNGPKGTGLGLAIVRHAVRSLDGTIRVESVWKQGTTMIVDLPEGDIGH